MTKKEFLKLENWIFDVYKESLSSDLGTNLKNSKEISKIFPFFHPNVEARLDVVQNKSFSNITHIQSIILENFPKRGYFKIGFVCKLCLLFLLFAGNLKGFNFPLFVSFLVFYYWYNIDYIRYIVKIDIEQFYQKKIEELNIKTSELEKYDLTEYVTSSNAEPNDVIKNNVEKIIERANKHKELTNIINTEAIINENVSENEKDLFRRNEEIEMSQIKDNKASEDEINQFKPEEIKVNKNKETGRLESFEIDPDVISSVKQEAKLSNKECETTYKLDLKKGEPLIVKIIHLIFGIAVSFVLSLYPNWCDNFEQNNPIIEGSNEDKNLSQEEPNREEINLNGVNLNKYDEENDILIENIDEKFNQPYSSSVVSPGEIKDKNEKVLIKSSTNTKKVNNDDEQTKYLFVEENEENRTEKEFVFSENINIDNLSYYNEPIESVKKKESDSTIKPQSANSNNGITK